jgi:DNA mismatch repair protein MutL
MMSEIQQLPSSVVDQIAAGEVVERPAHLVKELVENSLDAGCTQVIVEIADGGRFVKVTDNGKGIHKQELSKALDRFATSKIKSTDDLWKLKSFGFRGEALASISAVSKLSLTSRTAKASKAAKIESRFGVREAVVDSGGAQGTSLVVENLFENVPARLKFMKSSASEFAAIKMVIKGMALSYHAVEFQLFHNQSLELIFSATKSRLERASQVLEIDKLYEGFAERDGVKAHAVFADPFTTAKTSKNIWLFAQERYIQDRSLQAAVMEAYRHLLMHGEFPQAVVWVTTDPANIDVNIHPTKSQVKFVDPSLAFRAVQAAIRTTLEQAPWIERTQTSSVPTQELNVNSSVGPSQTVQMDFDGGMARVQQTSRAEVRSGHQAIPSNLSFHSQELDQTKFAQKNINFTEVASEAKYQRENMGYWSGLQILGQANLTYIIAQSAKSMVLVDQHAAHERVNWEKLMRAWRGGQIEVQDYLFPLTLDMGPEKVERLVALSQDLEKLGFGIEAMGPATIGIKSAPSFVKEKSIVFAIESMADEMMSLAGTLNLEKTVGDVIATLACHSSIRAGQALSTEEMQSLLVQMDEFPLSSFCPHGRPVFIEMPFAQLEKDFGRMGS